MVEDEGPAEFQSGRNVQDIERVEHVNDVFGHSRALIMSKSISMKRLESFHFELI